MSLLDSVENIVTGTLGAGTATGQNGLQGIIQLVQDCGGLQALVDKFTQGGFGDQVKTWIGNGANSPIGADAVNKVLGSSVVTNLASKLGVDPQQCAQTISQLLPQVVSKLTPNGQVGTESNSLLQSGLGALGSLLNNKA